MSPRKTRWGWACAAVFLLAAPLAAGEEAGKVELARKAEAILRANCYRCHGQDGAVEGGINYIADLRALLSRKKVIAGDPSKSLVFRRVSEGEMPPEDEQPRPGKPDIEALKNWIEAGAPVDTADAPARTFLAPDHVIGAIHRDLEATSERDRAYIRYFTLTHLYNAGLSDDELQSYRVGLSKLINSLSWGRRIVVPAAIDPSRTVFRVDLRDLKWSEKTWEEIVAANPYGIVPGSSAGAYINTATGTRLPWVRADWFVAAASRPPLYHEALQLPKTDRELEDQLHIKVLEEIRTERVARAGFNSSGVSRNNRVIERHESPYGAYWKSYDFASNSGRKNIFAAPLGPGGGALEFEPDGGEIIFNLPNGLQAYMLVDGQGQRIDKGPLTVVSDPKRPDRAVENGISCMSCHMAGMIVKSDQIREHARTNVNAFPAPESGRILALYPSKTTFDGLLAEDAERFQRAVKATGGRIGTTEPIVALTHRFESELDLDLAAAEAGMQPPAFRDRLSASPELARALGSLNVPGGTVQRQVFADAFGDVVGQMHLGEYLRPRSHPHAAGGSGLAILSNEELKKRLQGNWLVIATETNGAPAERHNLLMEERHWTFRGDSLVVTMNQKEGTKILKGRRQRMNSGQFVVDAAAHHFDMTGYYHQKGPKPADIPIRWVGIIDYQEGQVRIAIKRGPDPKISISRPNSFETWDVTKKAPKMALFAVTLKPLPR